MPKYIVLLKFSEQGRRALKDGPKRRGSNRDLANSLGGSIERAFMTMGRYDLVMLTEFPNDESAATMALKLTAQGNSSSETLRAFDEAETDKLLEAL